MRKNLVLVGFVACVLFTGCVGAKKTVVNNTFISERSPVGKVVVPESFLYLGEVKERQTKDQWVWNKKAYVFVEDENEDNVIERCITMQTNQINTSFVIDYYGSIDKSIKKEFVKVHGKMSPMIIAAHRPGSSGFVTNFLLEKGYTPERIILIKEIALRLRKNYTFSINYSEDVSYMGYSVEEWNDGSLDEKQRRFLKYFLERFDKAVSFDEVQYN